MRILMIDNYDSFTYNLVHYLNDLECEVTVKRNDKFEINEVADYDRVMLSPGPGIPDEAGLLKPVIQTYANRIPIFGVCLGLQAIGEVFGAELLNTDEVYHGIDTPIKVIVEDEPIFRGLGGNIRVGRYHSWVVDKPVPEVLEITSEDSDGYIMSLRHKEYDVKGVQFHPESVLTPDGKQILKNWIDQKS